MIKEWFKKCMREALSEVLSEFESGQPYKAEAAREYEKQNTETENSGEFKGITREIFNEWVYGEANNEKN